MTLITYLTRVHFADDVLEEALWSELEALSARNVLVLYDPGGLSEDMIERALSGMPVNTRVTEFCDVPAFPSEKVIRRIAELYRESGCDVIVAIGTARTIDLGKALRVAVCHDEPLSSFAYSRGGSRLIGTQLPDLFVVPDISGFGSAVSAHCPIILESGERALLMCKKLIPTVSICDPTLTLNANGTATASAGADAITQCIEAYLSNGYNPPAEGIALDGLKRAITNIGEALANSVDIEARREMMAASLNGALALQKGLGACQAISNAIGTVCDLAIRPGILNRIVLPSVLRFNECAAGGKYAALRPVFGLTEADNLADGVQAFLDELPLPRSFSEVGVQNDQLEAAAQIAAHDLATNTNPRLLGRDDFLDIMKSVH